MSHDRWLLASALWALLNSTQTAALPLGDLAQSVLVSQDNVTKRGDAASSNPSESAKPLPVGTTKVPPPQPLAKMVDRGEGVLKQVGTGLFWTQNDNGDDIGWNDSQRYCETLATGGSGWGLPSIAELRGIYDENLPNNDCTPPGGYADWTCKVSSLFSVTSAYYWTREQSVSGRAWDVSLITGKLFASAVDDSGFHRVLCVRRS